MKTLVIYDIPDDRLRLKVSEACKDYGLERIQYSAFWGNINQNRREEMFLRFSRILARKSGNIQIYPMCDKDFRLKMEIANDFGEEEEVELEGEEKGEEKEENRNEQ